MSWRCGGPWITGAYYQPDGNVSAPDKFHDGWLRTGDVATISPDGYMRIVDRTRTSSRPVASDQFGGTGERGDEQSGWSWRPR